MKTPKRKFVEYIQSLGLEAEESETYDILEKRVSDHFKTEETPSQVSPMLAEDATENPEQYWTNPNYICEEKLDGIRILMHFFKGRIRLTTRGKNPKTLLLNEKSDNYPQFKKCYRDDLEGTILDGEMLGGKNDNRSPIASIQAINGALPLQAVETQKKYGWARYRPFDVIYYFGKDITRWKWTDRRFILEMICPGIGLHPTKVCYENKKEFYMQICKAGGEGVMLKRRASRYYPNSREDCWLKVKRYDEAEVLIVGWSLGFGKNMGKVGSVTVAVGEKIVGAFGNLTDELREKMTASDGSLKKMYYGKKCVVRFQAPLKNLMRHCRFIRFIEEK